MKTVKVIIWLAMGFVIGLSFMPIKYWLIENENEYESEGNNLPYFDPWVTESKEKLIPLVKQGNTDAYNVLSVLFSKSENKEELLPYAFLMANKYGYKMAYFDVYSCLRSIYPNIGSIQFSDSLDETTRNLALEYLKKGAELGENNCQYRLGRYYLEGKYFEQDTILGQELIDKNKW